MLIKNIKTSIKKTLQGQNIDEIKVYEQLSSGNLSQNVDIMNKFCGTIDQSNYTKYIKASTIEGTVKNALATGTWVRKNV